MPPALVCGARIPPPSAPDLRLAYTSAKEEWFCLKHAGMGSDNGSNLPYSADGTALWNFVFFVHFVPSGAGGTPPIGAFAVRGTCAEAEYSAFFARSVRAFEPARVYSAALARFFAERSGKRFHSAQNQIRKYRGARAPCV